MRIVVGGIQHETNTYVRQPTGAESFRVSRGSEIFQRYEGVRTDVGGVLAAIEDIGATAVPTLFAEATPSGIIAADAYEKLADELLRRIEEAMPVDAVALPLHGAGVAVGVPSIEVDLCQRIRALVGPDVRIVLSLDLHGNVTHELARLVDGMFGVYEYPHTDLYDRGYEAVNLIARMREGVRPHIHVEHLPMYVPATASDMFPVQRINELCWEIEQRPDVIDVAFFHGFPYVDLPHVAASVVVTTDGAPEKARRYAQEVATWVWEHRDSFTPELRTARQAIEDALAVEGGPIVINETSDNPGGGTPGDGTHLLRAFIEAGLDSACFGLVYDPEVAEAAHAAGVGQTIQVSLGGKHDPIHGAPLSVSAYVKALTDGQFAFQGPMDRGLRLNLGKMARLQINGIDVVVSSVRRQTQDPEMFLLHGIDITRYKIVGIKSSHHFKAAFRPYVRGMIVADTPGLMDRDLSVFERKNVPGPMWPLDKDAEYSPADH